MCKGLPASGKSTFAKEFIKDQKDWIRINNDDLSTMMFGDPFAMGKRDEIDRFRHFLIEQGVAKRRNIIVDNTNLHPKHEEYLKGLVATHNESMLHTKDPELYSFEIKDFTDVPVAECIKRNKARTNPVPDKVIYQMYNSYINKPVATLVQKSDLPPAIIVDIDGTIANCDHRNPYDTSKCLQDSPIQPVVDLVTNYKQKGYKIFFVTGRKESSRADTVTWLKEKAKFFPTDYELFMRESGNNESDTIYKKVIFDNHIKDKYRVDFALEDRTKMVQMYRKEIGIICMQVADGEF